MGVWFVIGVFFVGAVSGALLRRIALKGLEAQRGAITAPKLGGENSR
jgi:hypothetical protein